MNRQTTFAIASLVILLAGGSVGCSTTKQQTSETESDESQEYRSTREADQSTVDDGDAETNEIEERDEGEIEVSLVGAPSVEGPGTLDQRLLAQLVEQKRRETVTCLENLTKEVEEPSRQVALMIRIGRDGIVLETQANSGDFGECVAREVASWSFPKPEGGEIKSTFEYRYEQKPEGEQEPKSGGGQESDEP